MNKPNNCIWKRIGKNTYECRNCWKVINYNPHMSSQTSDALDGYLEAKYQYRILPNKSNFELLKEAFHYFYHIRGVKSPKRIQIGFGLGSLYMGENTFLVS